METNELASTAPVHPGITLDTMLKAKDTPGSAFADSTGLSRSLVSQITRGNRRITPATAAKIVEFFQEGATIDWMRAQQEFDLWSQHQTLTAADANSN